MKCCNCFVEGLHFPNVDSNNVIANGNVDSNNIIVLVIAKSNLAKLPNFARKDSIFIYPGDLVADPAGKFAGAGPRYEPDPAGGGLVAVAGVDLLLRALDVRLARAPLVPVSSGLLSWGAPDSTERGVFFGAISYLPSLFKSIV